MDAENILKQVRQQFDFLRFTWVDMHGVAKGKTAPKLALESFFKDGLHAYNGELFHKTFIRVANIARENQV